jgi:cathepsin L
MAYRYGVFKTNLAAVSQHNEEWANGVHSFKLGMNQFGDMTNTEYRAYINKFQRPESPQFAFTVEARPGNPSAVDWRTKNVVTPIKDQGSCGSCWSFSAVGSMEGAHALSSGTLVSLSEQELVDCAAGGKDNCNEGGWMTDGFNWAIAKGMESEKDYPYTAQSKGVCHYDATKVVAKYTSYANVTVGSEDALETAVANQPTVSVAIDAGSFWFQLYSSGVYDDTSCKSDLDDLDHGVLAAGYGTDTTTSPSKDYWLVKNSWGAWWGESGYIRMVKDKAGNPNQCGIATCASFPIV